MLTFAYPFVKQETAMIHAAIDWRICQVQKQFFDQTNDTPLQKHYDALATETNLPLATRTQEQMIERIAMLRLIADAMMDELADGQFQGDAYITKHTNLFS